jgi:hypothetical protein
MKTHGLLASDDETDYRVHAFGCLIAVLVVKHFWPAVIPFEFTQFWHIKGSVLDWYRSSWMIFVWAFSVTTFVAVCTRNRSELNQNAEEVLRLGLKVSVRAGVMEEICFRWLIFYNAIIAAKIGNFFLFGLVRWIQLHVAGPVVNFVSFGALSEWLIKPSNWAVGAAIVSANAMFRDGHRYQGLLGFVNSWFMGLVFFWILFRFGLPAAIVIHFSYDMLIFVIKYIDCAVERSQENRARKARR